MEIEMDSRGAAESRRAEWGSQAATEREDAGALRAPESFSDEAAQQTAAHNSAPPRLCVQPSFAADRIVEIARGWIGTPYVHQASVKGVGCDCLGLLRGVWRELYGAEPEDVPPYSPDWAEATGAETLYMALKRHLTEIALPPFTGGVAQSAEGGEVPRNTGSSPVCGGGVERGTREMEGALRPGDIALFRMVPRGPAKHCGIIARSHPALDAEPHPPVGTRRYPPLGGGSKFAKANFGEGTLTLIHARQNKRVSEEPLSRFWTSKMTAVFRPQQPLPEHRLSSSP